MFDPFDPFDPAEPAPRTESAPDTALEGGAGTDAPSGSGPDQPSQRPARRWTTTASRRVQPDSSAPSSTAEAEAASTVPLADLASFRASTLSVLRASIERLRAFGHVASLVDGLDDARPTVAVHFGPDRGPLATWSEDAPEPARFELRVAYDLDGGTQVVAGYTPGRVGAPFTLLGRTHVDQMDRTWVSRRFLEFVQRVLTPS